MYLGNDKWAIPLEYQLYKEWIASLPKHTEFGWLDIFPEASKILKRETSRQIIELSQSSGQLFKEIANLKNTLFRVNPKDRFWAERHIEILNNKRDEIETKIKHKEWIIKKLAGAKDNPNSIRPDDIAMAKQTPITGFVDGRKVAGKTWARCPFHSEKTASFCIKENNTWRCFGQCGDGGDVIDFIQKKNNIKFLEAVRYLLNK